MKTRTHIILLVAVAVALAAAPAAHAQKAYAIRGATIHTLAGPPIENGMVVISNGKITAVGRNVSIPRGAQVINARGLHVYPGLFDVTQLGLMEIGQTPSSIDTNELGEFKPQIVAATAFHVESEHIPVARANGITHTVTTPGGGTIPGHGSLLNLSGWVGDEMMIRRTAALLVTWPNIGGGGGGFGGGGFGGGGGAQRPFTEAKREYDRRIEEIAGWLDRARHYAQAMEKASGKVERDLQLEGLVAVVKGEEPLLISANTPRQIRDAIDFCEKQKVKMILARGRDAWKVKDVLKAKNIPVILGPTQALPSNEDEAYDKPFSAAGELVAAGVRIAFATFDSSDSRTLPYEAANAVPYGLSHDEALKAITVNPAQFFGVGDKLGTIEQGKIGNLIVTNGDPLEITTEVRYLFINGQLTSTDNKHRQLWEKYRNRP